MNFLIETLRLGLANLLLHKLRSLLTALGIIFGVAAVIIMVAIGEGNKRKALADIEKLGAHNIIVRSVKPEEPTDRGTQRQFILKYGITFKDERHIRTDKKLLEFSTRIVPLKHVGVKVSRTNTDDQQPAAAFGTYGTLLDVTSLEVERGRYLTSADEQGPERVAVIGASIAERLFPLEDPLENMINIHNGNSVVPFKVVGVLRGVGLAGGAGSSLVGRDLNFDVHIPMATAINDFGNRIVQRKSGSFEGKEIELSELYIEAINEDAVDPVAKTVTRILEMNHGTKLDYTLIVPRELLEQKARTLRMFNMLMIFLAAVGLVVGGIGITNIMLASVTERIREIGIRRALGATRKHILSQFLVETTVLSALGGLIGVAFGLTVTAVLGVFQNQLEGIAPPVTTGWSIAVSMAVSMVVGILAGIYPAIQASKQDPIVALRHD